MEGVSSGAGSNQVNDVANAEVIMVIGANPTSNHPVAATWMKNAVKRGATLIVALLVTAVLTGMVLVMGESARVEMVAAGNREERVMVDAAERGAEAGTLDLKQDDEDEDDD